MANRHGIIAGATGTGKTITMKVMAESFSDMGVPVFLADIKGDLTGMCVAGTETMSQEEYRKAAVDAVRKLSADVGIPAKLAALKEEDLQFLAESAYADACAPGNPKEASVEDMKALIRQLM